MIFKSAEFLFLVLMLFFWDIPSGLMRCSFSVTLKTENNCWSPTSSHFQLPSSQRKRLKTDISAAGLGIVTDRQNYCCRSTRLFRVPRSPHENINDRLHMHSNLQLGSAVQVHAPAMHFAAAASRIHLTGDLSLLPDLRSERTLLLLHSLSETEVK